MMKELTVLDKFILDECTPDVATEILEAMRSRAAERVRMTLEFNMYEVTFDFSTRTVEVFSVIDGSPSGIQQLPLDTAVSIFTDVMSRSTR